MYNPFSLEGKHILVTGASSGIGQSPWYPPGSKATPKLRSA